jgi:hypothetical protein
MPRVEIFMRRTTVLILLSASLLSAPSSLSPIWSFFASLWAAPDSIDTGRPLPTPYEGCGLDPSGNPRCTPGS